MSFIGSIAFHSYSAVCAQDLDEINVSMTDSQQFYSEIAYFFFFILPLLLNLFISSYCALLSRLYYKENSLSVSLLTQIYDRLMFYPTILALCLIPSAVCYGIILVEDSNALAFCVCAVFATMSGILGSGYMLFSGRIDKSRRHNLYWVSVFFPSSSVLDEKPSIISVSDAASSPTNMIDEEGFRDSSTLHSSRNPPVNLSDRLL